MPFRVDIYTRYIAQNKNISSNDKQKCLRDKQSTNKERSLILSSQLPKKKTVLRLHENNFQIFSCFCLINLINKKTLKRIWSEKS